MSGVNTSGGAMAGFGIYCGDEDPRNEGTALQGKEQSAQRAEVAATAGALMKAQKPVEAVSDSRYTVDTTQKLLKGGVVEDNWRHRDLWVHIGRNVQIKNQSSG